MWVRTLSICLVVGVVVSLTFGRLHPFGNASLYLDNRTDAFMDGSSVPSEVRTILAAKCADCHSTQTRSPFYGRFAPVSWLMERDINRGRKAMNLSRWKSYSTLEQETLAAQILHETREHEMPLPQYRLIHWGSRITDADIRTLANWAHASSKSSDGLSDSLAGQGDPARGQQLFEKTCIGCHALTQNRQGPRLQGVFGRTSGTVGDYAYSAALKKSHIVWDEQSLDKWLTDPDASIPGNEMDFLVSRPAERRDLIAFLRQRSGK